MSSNNNSKIISTASPHSIKKFELIEEYVKSWAKKLLNYDKCKGIVFIDCMCNSGVYKDNNGNEVVGTPLRVAKYLNQIIQNYPSKKCWIFFNDLSQEKINLLNSRLPLKQKNCNIHTSVGDGNQLLINIGKKLPKLQDISYLLIYDPYKATINWNALTPFFNYWGEVIINHMISDPIRDIKIAKKSDTIQKYENTYLKKFEDIIPYGTDKIAYEKRVEQIIKILRNNINRDYYISAYPFFNSKNVIIYNLIHCTSNIQGFKLYKKTAWKVFGGKSSTKNTHGLENQLMFDFTGNNDFTTLKDEFCYNINDIAEYLQDRYAGKENVPFDEIWRVLELHPVFPSEGFRSKIRKALKDNYRAITSNNTITFINRR